ncbi:hypothetical protein SNEBB_010715 [Seison nebaliae]|nr:hypothetical protein SNEBB_010715 [Seison nebaliae]
MKIYINQLLQDDFKNSFNVDQLNVDDLTEKNSIEEDIPEKTRKLIGEYNGIIERWLIHGPDENYGKEIFRCVKSIIDEDYTKNIYQSKEELKEKQFILSKFLKKEDFLLKSLSNYRIVEKLNSTNFKILKFLMLMNNLTYESIIDMDLSSLREKMKNEKLKLSKNHLPIDIEKIERNYSFSSSSTLSEWSNVEEEVNEKKNDEKIIKKEIEEEEIEVKKEVKNSFNLENYQLFHKENEDIFNKFQLIHNILSNEGIPEDFLKASSLLININYSFHHFIKEQLEKILMRNDNNHRHNRLMKLFIQIVNSIFERISIDFYQPFLNKVNEIEKRLEIQLNLSNLQIIRKSDWDSLSLSRLSIEEELYYSNEMKLLHILHPFYHQLTISCEKFHRYFFSNFNESNDYQMKYLILELISLFELNRLKRSVNWTKMEERHRDNLRQLYRLIMEHIDNFFMSFISKKNISNLHRYFQLKCLIKGNDEDESINLQLKKLEKLIDLSSINLLLNGECFSEINNFWNEIFKNKINQKYNHVFTINSFFQQQYEEIERLLIYGIKTSVFYQFVVDEETLSGNNSINLRFTKTSNGREHQLFGRIRNELKLIDDQFFQLLTNNSLTIQFFFKLLFAINIRLNLPFINNFFQWFIHHYMLKELKNNEIEHCLMTYYFQRFLTLNRNYSVNLKYLNINLEWYERNEEAKLDSFLFQTTFNRPFNILLSNQFMKEYQEINKFFIRMQIIKLKLSNLTLYMKYFEKNILKILQSTQMYLKDFLFISIIPTMERQLQIIFHKQIATLKYLNLPHLLTIHGDLIDDYKKCILFKCDSFFYRIFDLIDEYCESIRQYLMKSPYNFHIDPEYNGDIILTMTRLNEEYFTTLLDVYSFMLEKKSYEETLTNSLYFQYYFDLSNALENIILYGVGGGFIRSNDVSHLLIS